MQPNKPTCASASHLKPNAGYNLFRHMMDYDCFECYVCEIRWPRILYGSPRRVTLTQNYNSNCFFYILFLAFLKDNEASIIGTPSRGLILFNDIFGKYIMASPALCVCVSVSCGITKQSSYASPLLTNMSNVQGTVPVLG